MAVPTRVEDIMRWTLLCLLALTFAAHAAAPTLGSEDIDLAADVLNSDTRNDVHVMSGNVRITQGELSIESQRATATGLQAENSRWTFERDVHLRSAAADLRSNSANAAFIGGRIATATVQGTPATFQQRGVSGDDSVRGRANVIEYDFGKGTVKMTENVWFTYGGNEFRGDIVVYDLNQERVVVNPGGKTPEGGKGRVNITIRPGSGIVRPGTPADQTEKKE